MVPPACCPNMPVWGLSHRSRQGVPYGAFARPLTPPERNGAIALSTGRDPGDGRRVSRHWIGAPGQSIGLVDSTTRSATLAVGAQPSLETVQCTGHGYG